MVSKLYKHNHLIHSWWILIFHGDSPHKTEREKGQFKYSPEKPYSWFKKTEF